MSTETSLSTRCKQRAVIEFLTVENCVPKEIQGRLKKVYGDETIDKKDSQTTKKDFIVPLTI